MHKAFWVFPCLLLLACGRQMPKMQRRPLYENSIASRKDLPKQTVDKDGLATPPLPDMCFVNEYAGLTEGDLIQRFGNPESSSILNIEKINMVGTHAILIDKEFLIKELGGKVLIAEWAQGEWDLTAYFWPSTKTCLGCVRKQKDVLFA